MRVSVIATVLNEGESIRQLMDSLCAQTRQPDELIIVDGGSRDTTVAVIESYRDRLPLRVVVEPGANISRGRNVAAQNATGEILAITDAGVRLEPAWLAELIAPFESDSALGVVAGFFFPDPQTVFEAAMGATVLPQVGDIDPATFLPSSRSVAVRRSAFEVVGGYPEWLDYCEDLIFDLRLKTVTSPFAFAPGALAHFRPRGSIRAFYKQYYLYARGDGKADLWRKRHLIRYATYLIGLPVLIGLALAVSPWFWLLLLAGGVIYCRTPLRRLPAALDALPFKPSAWDWVKAAAWIPVIRAVGDVAKMIGYPVGLRWRRENQPPAWR
ncbi:MAG: glycosyltransferase [Anaerolineae bacterium]|jgi:glycosyltransferase involved in cell wall biosynthesis|nr:glycosyltransferase [Anaerolineae bacterium]